MIILEKLFLHQRAAELTDLTLKKVLFITLESEINVRRMFINSSRFSHPYASYFRPNDY